MDKNSTININCQNEDTKTVMLSFFSDFKSNIIPVITSLFRSRGLESDPAISVSGDDVTVEQVASTKGMVLSVVDNNVASVDYSELADGSVYLVKEVEKMVVFSKSETGKPDVRLGHFMDLDSALRNLNSDEVQQQAERTKQLAESKEEATDTTEAITDAVVIEAEEGEADNG